MNRRISRRRALQETAGGLGAVAAAWLTAPALSGATNPAPRLHDLAPKSPHFAPRAKAVIFLYMGGGPSTVDLFDPKPALRKYDGKPAPFEIKGRRLNGSQEIMASPFEFRRRGETGRWVSSLLPRFAEQVDKTAFVRSMWTDRIDHSTAQFTFVTGRGIAGFPSLGSWVAYGLGSENQDLPAFIALEDSPATIKTRAYGSAWLPPIYGGTKMNAEGSPIFDVSRPDGITPRRQRDFLSTVEKLNRLHQRNHPLDVEFESRIANFELAAKMQLSALDAADLSDEPESAKKLYGLDDEATREYGARCLLARRLVEKGVRFVTVINGGWDHHSNIKESIEKLCRRTDRGTAALLEDLSQRGLLDETLVVWAGEFGRLPTIEARQDKPGRDHNPYGFNIWMAGGGVRPGAELGETDELGYAAVEEAKVGHSDVHATILHLLGLDFQKLTFRHEGRDESLVGVAPARVLDEILA